MKNKTFDCVEMKCRGAQRIQEATAGMSLAEKVEYWRQRNAAFRQEQDAAKRAGPAPGGLPPGGGLQQTAGAGATAGGGGDDVIDAEFEEKK